jgi:hypothetical protein
VSTSDQYSSRFGTKPNFSVLGAEVGAEFYYSPTPKKMIEPSHKVCYKKFESIWAEAATCRHTSRFRTKPNFSVLGAEVGAEFDSAPTPQKRMEPSH